MKLTTVLLIFIVGCQFELPKVGDGGTDTPTVDAPECPADYAPLPGSLAGHVYLKTPLGGSGNWSQQFDFCRGTSSRAYLAVPNDATEQMNLDALAAGSFWSASTTR